MSNAPQRKTSEQNKHRLHALRGSGSPTNEERIVIMGGVPLRGEVQLSGSKNASLAILAATLLVTKGQSVLHNVPHIADVDIMCEMLAALGADVQRHDHTVCVNAENLTTHVAPDRLVRKMRASFYVAAPLLARLQKAEVPLPGGCVLGARPINYHVEAFQKMGASINVVHGAMNAEAHYWRGANIYLEPKNSSVGATVNIMMAGCLAHGTTTIENAAREPEVVNLAEFLNKTGAQIHGAGTATITIEGVKDLHGAEHSIDFDRIEAGTYLAAAAITGGDITVHGLTPAHLPIYLDKLSEAGLNVTHSDEASTQQPWIRVQRGSELCATDVTTAPFPGFATDLQPLFVTLMCLANGRSAIEENLYDGRFNFVPELMRMGAQVALADNTAIVRGVPHLSGAEVQASDLRAGAALVLAGLAAEGRTEVTNVHLVDRGYEEIEDKLKGLGAQITRQTKTKIDDR
ncbi:MAG TPA: UDP-N-acetylglucosamine 1-carboxyvinyltransferase [Abditibacteriaceae bacterium]